MEGGGGGCCCSSIFSPAEGQASRGGVSGCSLTPQQLQAQALHVHFYQVDAVVSEALGAKDKRFLEDSGQISGLPEAAAVALS